MIPDPLWRQNWELGERHEGSKEDPLISDFSHCGHLLRWGGPDDV